MRLARPLPPASTPQDPRALTSPSLRLHVCPSAQAPHNACCIYPSSGIVTRYSCDPTDAVEESRSPRCRSPAALCLLHNPHAHLSGTATTSQRAHLNALSATTARFHSHHGRHNTA
jgi:hypothetical protein